MSPVLADVMGLLACPHCGGGLRLTGPVAACASGHAFDVARHGYLNLLVGPAPATRGDTAAMVAARAGFLGAGHFAPIAGQLAAMAAAVTGPGGVVDLGAGTGYHLAAVLDRLHGRPGVGLDVSTYAARRAARCHTRAAALVCDVWRALPLRTGAAGVVLDVFAPRNAAETRRVLDPAGALVVVRPTARHLGELVTRLGLVTVDADKERRLRESLHGHFTCQRESGCEFTMVLDRGSVEAVVAMGPSAWHTRPEALRERLRELPEPLPVTASVTLTAYRPVSGGADRTRSAGRVEPDQ